MQGKINICIFGDSIVYGQGDTKSGGWATRLRNYFESQANSKLDARVYVLGIRGETSQGLLTRLTGECAARKPDIVVFAIGINDSQYNDDKEKSAQTPISNFKRNIERLLDISRNFTQNIVFVGLTQVDESKTIPTKWGAYYDNENIKQYDEVIKELCHVQKIIYIPTFKILSSSDLLDGIHPNTDGHKKMFEKIRNNIETILN